MYALHHLSLIPWVDEILRGSYDHLLDGSIVHKFAELIDCRQFQIQ